MQERLLRLAEVKAYTGLCRSAIYAAMSAGSFPRAVHVGTRSVAWVSSEIDRWISERISSARGLPLR